MRFEVDENLPIEVAEILKAAGHDAATVSDEAVGGAPDRDIAALVRREGRARPWLRGHPLIPASAVPGSGSSAPCPGGVRRRTNQTGSGPSRHHFVSPVRQEKCVKGRSRDLAFEDVDT